MPKGDDRLIGQAIIFCIAGIILYNTWHLIVAALVVCGAVYVYNEIQKNNK